MNSTSYIHPDLQAATAFFSRGITDSVVMLNLLRFREEADYTSFPAITPKQPITGEQAYQIYMREVTPLIQAAGSELIFVGKADAFLIGPSEEKWDMALLVRHASPQRFMQFAQDPAYKKVEGHRTAALADSRLLPIWEKS